MKTVYLLLLYFVSCSSAMHGFLSALPAFFFSRSELSEHIQDVVAVWTCGCVNGGSSFLVFRSVERSHGPRAG